MALRLALAAEVAAMPNKTGEKFPIAAAVTTAVEATCCRLGMEEAVLATGSERWKSFATTRMMLVRRMEGRELSIGRWPEEGAR